MRARPLMLVLLGAAVAAGCDPGFETESIVKDTRVLAMRSEPAEVVVPDLNTVIDAVDLEVLWADPANPAERPWTLKACAIKTVFNAGQGEQNQIATRCEDDVLALPLGEGRALPGAPIRASFRADIGLLQRAREADPLKGFDGQVSIAIEVAIGEPTDPLRVYAQKRVTYSLPIPAGKTANRNPALARIEASGAELTDGAVFAPGKKLKLDPKAADGAAEAYRVFTFTGATRDLTEALRYSFFATAGEFTREKTGGAKRVQIGSQPAETDTEWTTPKKPGPVQLWFVIRDERGGTSWLLRTVEIR